MTAQRVLLQPIQRTMQVAAIMHYKEVETVLEVTDVDLQISSSDCGLQAVATAYELCAGNDPHGNTINFAHTFRNA